MDDDDKKSEDEGAKLREVSEEELKLILAAHKTWLETDVQRFSRPVVTVPARPM